MFNLLKTNGERSVTARPGAEPGMPSEACA